MDQEEQDQQRPRPGLENALWNAISLPKLAAFVTTVETASYFSKDTGFPISMLLLGAFTLSLSVKAVGRAIITLPGKLFTRKRPRPNDEQLPAVEKPKEVQESASDLEEEEYQVKRVRLSEQEPEEEPEIDEGANQHGTEVLEEESEGSSSSEEESEETSEEECEFGVTEKANTHVVVSLVTSSSDDDDSEHDDEEEEGRESPDLLVGRSSRRNETTSSLKTEESEEDEDDLDEDEEEEGLPLAGLTQDISGDDEFEASQSIYERFTRNVATPSSHDFVTPKRAAWKPSPSISALKAAQQRYLHEPSEQNCLKAMLEMGHHQYHCQQHGVCKYFGKQCSQWAVYEAHVSHCPTLSSSCDTCSKTMKLLWEHFRGCSKSDCDVPVCVRRSKCGYMSSQSSAS